MFNNLKETFNKVYTLVDTRLDNYIAKARSSQYDDLEKYSINFEEETDTLGANGQGYLDKKSIIDFDFLRQLSTDSVVQAIVLRRVNEIAAFCHPQNTKYESGFTIKKRDEKADVSKEEEQEMAEIEVFLCNTGLEQGRDDLSENKYNFEEWCRLVTRDRLVYNQIGTERIFHKVQQKDQELPKLHSFYHVPGQSLRRAVQRDTKEQVKAIKELLKENTAQIDPEKAKETQDHIDKSKEIAYVQIFKNQVINAFTRQELIYKFGNLNAELDNNGYAQGELELAVTLVNAHVFTETHNRLYFTQGFSNKGILAIKANVGKKILERFKQQFRQQMQGTANSFRVPILAGTEIQWVPFQENLKDMEWREWNYYLIRLICAFFQMSPQEINFDISRGASGSTMGDSGSRQEVILSHFKETGIRPLLRWLENIVNNEIIRYYNEEYFKKYVFRFTGIDSEQEKDEIDRLIKEVQYYKTINEARSERDLDELDEYGDLILNASWIQYITAKEQTEQMQGQSDMFGGFNEGEQAPGEQTNEANTDVYEDTHNAEAKNNMNEIMNPDKEVATKAVEKAIKKSIKLHRVEYYTKD